jgi:N-acetylmuramoyl-L-alanine amidase
MSSDSRNGVVVVLVIAALLPAGFALWLLWQVFTDDPGSTSTAALADPSTSATPSPRPTARKTEHAKATDEADGNHRKPLAGKVVVLDPGHNVHNAEHTAEINRLVDDGTGRKACDTTGTATNGGYPEASFTLDVARRVRTLLRAEGAKVELTQDGDRAWGPCVNERARIGNEAHADAALSIHADGSTGAHDRGFHVILPARVHTATADTTAIVSPSRRLGEELRKHFAATTSFPYANYLGGGTGMTVRQDLGGLNLSKVPKVFIECGNMRNPTDARDLTSPAWRQLAAKGIAEGISAFLVKNS